MRALFALAVVSAVSVTISPAAAQSRRGDGGTVVTGCSNFGKGCISGATRQGQYGREVRLPGGTWIGCRANCAETLRDETLDFWMKRDSERGGVFRRR